MRAFLHLLITVVTGLDFSDKWRIHEDRMDADGSCELVGNNDAYPKFTYGVIVFENLWHVSVTLEASTLDHEPSGRTSFIIPHAANHQRRSCQQYLIAAETSFKNLSLTMMHIPRVHVGRLRPNLVNGPGGFTVKEYIVSNTTRIWETSTWAQVQCPTGNGYTVFATTPPSQVMPARGICGSVGFMREIFIRNLS